MPIKFVCPYCGHQTLVADEYVGHSGPCAACGKTVTIPAAGQAPGGPRPPDIGQDPTLRMLLPVGRSGWAIAAGYAGLFALFCGVPGPIALILGLVAVRDIKRHPERHGMGRAVFGIVAGIIGTAALVVGIVMAVLNA
jgi:hypothetical protein